MPQTGEKANSDRIDMARKRIKSRKEDVRIRSKPVEGPELLCWHQMDVLSV